MGEGDEGGQSPRNQRKNRRATQGRAEMRNRDEAQRKGKSHSNNHKEPQMEQECIRDQQAKPRTNPIGERRRRQEALRKEKR